MLSIMLGPGFRRRSLTGKPKLAHPQAFVQIMPICFPFLLSVVWKEPQCHDTSYYCSIWQAALTHLSLWPIDVQLRNLTSC